VSSPNLLGFQDNYPLRRSLLGIAEDHIQWMTATFVAETPTAEIATCIAVAQHRLHGQTQSLMAPESKLVYRWTDRDVYQKSTGRMSAAA
jgi:hypothetical protein